MTEGIEGEERALRMQAEELRITYLNGNSLRDVGDALMRAIDTFAKPVQDEQL